MLAKWNIQAAFLFFGTCTLATVGMYFGLPEVSDLPASISPISLMISVSKPILRRHRRDVPCESASQEVQHLRDEGSNRTEGGSDARRLILPVGRPICPNRSSGMM